MNIKQYQYQAFMSYAHDDERIATRLHRALETYRVPKALRKTHLEKISPIFRDVTELTACLLYTSPSPRDRQKSRMPSSA